MNYISPNIKHLRLKKELSQDDFGALFGLSRDKVAHYERGGEPKIDTVVHIAEYFHIELKDFIHKDLVKIGYQVEDAGPRHQEATITEGDTFDFGKRTDKREDIQRIPLLKLTASAGLVQLFDNPENVIDYIQIPNMPKCDGAVHITGDSMYPLLKSGDIVAYKQINDLVNGIFYGEMYILALSIDNEDYTTVKYIQKSELGDDYFRLVSQNQHHAPKDIPKSCVRAVGFIKASIRINSMI